MPAHTFPVNHFVPHPVGLLAGLVPLGKRSHAVGLTSSPRGEGLEGPNMVVLHLYIVPVQCNSVYSEGDFPPLWCHISH